MWFSFFLVVLFLRPNKIILSAVKYDICKLSATGFEYMGKLSQTTNGNECEYWESVKLPNGITKNNFPQGNIRMARNYCRNPDNSTDGPWCYTRVSTGEQSGGSSLFKRENCTIPICINGDVNCKETGPGMEYSGNVQKSMFENECLHWTVTNREGEIDRLIPEGSIMLAGKSCRNPSDNLGGPWCYVLNEEHDEDEQQTTSKWFKEPCNIPLCFSSKQPASVTVNKFGTDIENYYTHFSSINGDQEEVTFSIKLWDPKDWYNGELKLAVSALAIPVNGNQLREWDIGYEVIIRNVGAGVTPHADEDTSWTNVPGLVSGLHWSILRLNWGNGFVTIMPEKSEKPYVIHEYKPMEHGILSEERSRIKLGYVSVMGTAMFWNMSRQQQTSGGEQEDQCVEHIVFGQNKITRYWEFLMASMSKYINLNVRCSVECIIEMRISPQQQVPLVQVIMKVDGGNNVYGEKVSEISVKVYKGGKNIVTLIKQKMSSIFSYWTWEEFTISISGQRMNMLITKSSGTEPVFDISDKLIQGVKWYGIMSTGVSHWSFFCVPSVKEYEPVPPECSVSSLDSEYEGHQWVTHKGHPCIPWVANIGNFKDSNFPEGKISTALNYCRNPTSEGRGAYCYTADLTGGISINQESCKVRKCKFKDCRIAGTGNDFMGEVSTTITERKCQAWTSDSPQHPNPAYLKDEFFPDKTVGDAKNYCRDPSSQLGGPWCYTTDPELPVDLCNVPDCFKPESCIMIVKAVVNNQVFIVPYWRAFGIPVWVKIWDPDIVTALVLSFYPSAGTYYYKLIIGDDNNERIKLFYSSPRDGDQLLKQKTIEHTLSTGIWIGIKIELEDEEISLTWEGTPKPFFIWRKGSNENLPPIKPMYFSFDAKSDHGEGSIGLNFPCDVCQTHICNRIPIGNTLFYPFNIWLENSTRPAKNISFYLRGEGSFTANLYTLPDKQSNGKMIIDDGVARNLIEVHLKIKRYVSRKAVHATLKPSIQKNSWTKFTFSYGEIEGAMYMNDSLLMKWQTTAVQYFYYFSPECTHNIIWTANCEPPEIDGKPKDGGWSEWSAWECSVTCGGGRGLRRRQCTNPKPSMFGKFCEGSSTDTGMCNEISCGEITVNTINSIRSYLASNATTLEVYEHETFAILCNVDALKMIIAEAPKTMIHWMKNGEIIGRTVTIENIQPEEFQIQIQAANLSDTGIYACVVELNGQEREIVDISSVIVKTNHLHTNILRAGQKLQLKANSLLLNDLYDNLRLTWMINKKIYKEYDIYDLKLIDNELINPVKRLHTGEWTSVVFQDQLKLNWTTSWYNVLVKKKASWATYLLEEDLLRGQIGDNEIIIYVGVGVTFLIVIVITAGITIFIIRIIKSFNKTNELNTNTLE